MRLGCAAAKFFCLAYINTLAKSASTLAVAGCPWQNRATELPTDHTSPMILTKCAVCATELGLSLGKEMRPLQYTLLRA